MSTYIKLLTFPKVRELVNSKITNMLVQDVDSEGGYVAGWGGGGWGKVAYMGTMHFPFNFTVKLKLLFNTNQKKKKKSLFKREKRKGKQKVINNLIQAINECKYTAYSCSTVNYSDLLKHKIKYNLFLKFLVSFRFKQCY